MTFFIVFTLLVFIVAIFMFKKGKKEEAKSLLTKNLSWFFIIPLMLLPMLFGRVYFITLVMILSLLCFRELSLAVGLWKDVWFTRIGYVSILLIYAAVYFDNYSLFTAMPFLCSALILLAPILRGEFEGMIQKTSLTLLGVLYIGWFFAHVAFLTNMLYGFSHILFLFMLTELNDVFAFSGGKLFGRHKLDPKISPNKTWEGAFTAIVCTMLMAFAIRFAIPEFATWQVLVIGLIISVGGTFGDLTESYIKRDLKIKDMGKIIPGHGGLLDRFDSLIFVAPLFFQFVRLFFWPLFFHP
jgi:phosphatidate cytidylyltransferase